LCANAAAPTHGRRGLWRMFATSSTNPESSLSFASDFTGTEVFFSFNATHGITLVRLQLPVRSP
jgi:hypothetical protein